MPAIYSNDPNAGIRQMLGSRAEMFIPTPLNSMTFKGNAGMNAKRASSYLNAPSKVRTMRESDPGFVGPPKKLMNPPERKKGRLPGDPSDPIEVAKARAANEARQAAKPAIPASVMADNMINEYLNAQNQAMKVAMNPGARPMSWNGADPADWLSRQPKPVAKPGMAPDMANKLNWWNKAGATDLPSTRYGYNTGMA